MQRTHATITIAGGIAVLLTVVQIFVNTPTLGTSRVPVMISAGSDDAHGETTAVVREAVRETETVPRATRTKPAQVADVDAPRSLDAVASARGVALTAEVRSQATRLAAKVIPASALTAASAATKDAVEAFIGVGPAGVTSGDPCVKVGAGQRAALMEAFWLSQGRLPENREDYQFACALVTKPNDAIDVTKEFTHHRKISQEELALKAFIAFFGRLPSKDRAGNALVQDAIEKDWWAVKYLTYHPILASDLRDLSREAKCIDAFKQATFTLYKRDAKTKKLRGAPPSDLWDWDIIRACAYSGAPFLERFAQLR